jgi:hypothetical protein
MRKSALLLSAFHFVLLSFFMLLGFLFIALGENLHFKMVFGNFLDSYPKVFFLFGLGVVALSALLFIALFALHKKVFFQVQMGLGRVEIDPSLVQSYVKECLKEATASEHPLCEVRITEDQKIEISAKLAVSSEEDYENLLRDIERRLKETLRANLGYTKDFSFIVIVA